MLMGTIVRYRLYVINRQQSAARVPSGRVEVEGGRIGQRKPEHGRPAGVVLLGSVEGVGQVGGKGEAPAPERLTLPRPPSLLVLDEAERWRRGQIGQAEPRTPRTGPPSALSGSPPGPGRTGHLVPEGADDHAAGLRGELQGC